MLSCSNWAGDCLLYLSSKVEFNQIQIFFFQFKNRSKSSICCENGEYGKIAEIKKLLHLQHSIPSRNKPTILFCLQTKFNKNIVISAVMIAQKHPQTEFF